MGQFALNLRFLEQVVCGRNLPDDEGEMKTLFDQLHTKEGKRTCYEFFKKHSDSTNGAMDENEITCFLRELTNLNDFEILDVADIFDVNYTGTIFWKEFYLMVAAYASLASRQTVKFLYKHGAQVFALLRHHHTSEHLDFEQFACLGSIFGIMEQDLVQSILKDFKVTDKQLREKPIDQEHFVLYYFTTLKKLDTHGTVVEYTADDLLKSSPLCICAVQ